MVALWTWPYLYIGVVAASVMASDSFWVVAGNTSLWSYLLSFYQIKIEGWKGAFVSVHSLVLYMNVLWFQKFSGPLVQMMIQDLWWGPVNLVSMGPYMLCNSTLLHFTFCNICFMLFFSCFQASACFSNVVAITVGARYGMNDLCLL